MLAQKGSSLEPIWESPWAKDLIKQQELCAAILEARLPAALLVLVWDPSAFTRGGVAEMASI